MGQQGKALSTDQKKCIVILKKAFDIEKKQSASVSTEDSTGRVAGGSGIGRRSVESVIASYNKNGHKIVDKQIKPPGRTPCAVNNDLIPCIRQYIRFMNKQGQYLSVRNIRTWLIQEYEADIPRMTLWRFLQRIGFVCGEGKRRSALKEQDCVIIARRKYLRKKIENRNSDGTLKRPEIYPDETYVNKNHSNGHTWYMEEDGPRVNKPSGKGPRSVIAHAITKDGRADGANSVFEAKKRSGDYHNQMNRDIFSKWFINQLLPNIPQNSIIVMDNAKYHNVLSDDSFPTPKSRKHELQEWLTLNGYHWDDDMLRAELYELCKRYSPSPKFRPDAVAEDCGHTIIRTPQYHPELQPVEK